MALFSKRYHPPGTPPGTTRIGPTDAGGRQLSLTVADYSADHFKLLTDVTLDDCHQYMASENNTWIHIDGQPSQDLVNYFTDSLGLHPLAVEDVINTGQRAKYDHFGEQIFVVFNLPVLAETELVTYQFSMFLGDGFIVSIGEQSKELVDHLFKRLRDPQSRIRSRGCDYLLYLILDLIVDQAFPILENLGAQLEDLESRILDKPDKSSIAELHFTKRQLITLRRSLWPQREVINDLMREDSYFKDETRMYLRDSYDHTIHILDMLETYRDMSASLLDIYLSTLSVKMNDIMRVLTLISTVFIPLTFFTGIYGMNFDHATSQWNMPELHWRYGYPVFWLVIVATTIGMLVFFRRKRWI
jgi:magnesium transporter